MHTKRTMALALAAILAVMACTPAVAPSASAPASQPPASQAPASTEPSTPAASPSEAPLAVDPAEAVIPNVEAERRDRLLDVLPVADLRRVHQGNDRPLRGHVPRRQGQLGRPSGHLPGGPQQRVLRRQRTRRHQPVGRRGLGRGLRDPGRPPGPRRDRSPGSQGHLLRGPLEVTAGRRQELPVPVVPGHRRRADQQAHLRGRRRPGRRRLPEDDGWPAGRLQDHPGQDRVAVRHPPDGQRPARADDL